MSVTAPPRPPRPDRSKEPLDREEIEALVEALIEEVRQETRRRRRKYWAIAALVALVGVVVLIVLEGGAASQTASPALSARSSLPAAVAASKIAFVSEPVGGGYCGVVYVMNADGSGQRMLAKPDSARVVEALRRTGCGQEGDPAWSPDGRRIALVSNGIYVMNADGSGERKLTPGGSPAWSPDGRRIAFARDGVYVVNADGSEERRLTRTGDTPTWSPNGQKLAFTSALTSGPNGNSEIYVVNADGSGQRRLTRNTVRDGDPVWSPDGRRIAFESNWQVWVMNADGSGKRKLTLKGAHNQNPAWSPDGQRIAFERGGRQVVYSYKPGSAGFEVYVMNADGSAQQRLTRGGSQPRWSPDGRTIAYLSKRGGNRDIWIMNADGSEQRNLTRAAGRRESGPVWSPAQ